MIIAPTLIASLMFLRWLDDGATSSAGPSLSIAHENLPPARPLCGPNAVQFICAWYGDEVEAEELIQELVVSRDGSLVGDCVDYLESRGLSITWCAGGGSLAPGEPALMIMPPNEGCRAHMAVVFRVDRDSRSDGHHGGFLRVESPDSLELLAALPSSSVLLTIRPYGAEGPHPRFQLGEFSTLLVADDNYKCSPQQDCPDLNCTQFGSNPDKCHHKDDYEFREINSCVAASAKSCTLMDWGTCYDHVICDRNPVFQCSDSFYCGTYHNNCVTTTIYAYDDCETTNLR